MPRKVTVSLERKISPDRKYQSILIQRLINKSMKSGKKLVAERAVYSAVENAAKKLDSENPVEVFERALKNVSPNFEAVLAQASSMGISETDKQQLFDLLAQERPAAM